MLDERDYMDDNTEIPFRWEFVDDLLLRADFFFASDFRLLKQNRFIGKQDWTNIYVCNFIEMADERKAIEKCQRAANTQTANWFGRWELWHSEWMPIFKSNLLKCETKAQTKPSNELGTTTYL